MALNDLVDLVQKVDSLGHQHHQNDLYYKGRQPLAFLSDASRKALNGRFGKISSNLGRLQITALTERLVITGFSGTDIWPLWVANDLDQLSGVAHREALALGQSFVLVWVDALGNPRATIESAWQCAVRRDPVTREVVQGVKVVRHESGSDAWLYGPDEIEHFHSNSKGAVAGSSWTLVETVPNPLGMVPLVPITNSDRLLDDDGVSELDDTKDVIDGLNAALAGLAVALEYTARPRRWATGIELVERPVLGDDGQPLLDDDDELVVEFVNPIAEDARMVVVENNEAKLGQWDGADLAGYENAVRIWLGQYMAQAAVPAHMCGITTENPASADAIRSAESSLIARASARAATFGKSWEQVARLLVAVRDGVDPRSVQVRVSWRDFGTRSEAQAADAAVKLYQAGVLSRAAVLRSLGYDDEAIAAELAQVRDDATIASDLRLGSYMNAIDRREA